MSAASSRAFGRYATTVYSGRGATHSQLAVDLATEQYKAGLTDFLSVLDAERDLYANEDQLVQSQTTVATNLIGLYRALGGGWSVSSSTVSVNKHAP